MKILEKRPLAIILCVMLGGFSFFINFDWQIKLILATLPLLIISVIYIFDNLKQGRNAFVLLALLVASAASLLSALWSITFYPSEYYDKNATIVAHICDMDNSETSTVQIVCKTQKINGKNDRHTFIMNVDKNVAINIRKYDVITVNADICEFSDYDDGFDGRSYYISKGYSATLENVDLIQVHENKVNKFEAFFKNYKLKISNRLKLNTDFDTGSFLSALLVGNRQDLSGSIKLNFARLGISHILALSGMHLAILSLAINFLLSRLGVNKKLRALMMILIVSFYMILTGLSLSVTRAGIMLIISSVLYLLSNKADSITSLLIAVFVIVLFNPCAVFDLSLWLSAFATLGVIVYAEIPEKNSSEYGFFKNLLHGLKNACLVSVFAFCATFAFTASRYNNFSIASVITTLIFSFIIQLFIYAGMIIMLVGGIIPIGKVIISMSNGILWLAEQISSFKFIYVSMNSFVVKLLIVLLTVFFFSFLVFEMKNKRIAIGMILVLLTSIFLVAEIDTLVKRYDDDVVYAPSNSGDVTMLKSDGDLSLVYSGNARSSAGWDVLDFCIDESITYIDNFVIANYSHSTIDFVNVVIDGIKVQRILLPEPTTDEELGQAEGISYLLSNYGARLEFYKPLTYVKLGEYKYRLFNKCDYVYGSPVQNVYEIVYFDSRLTYVSACEFSELPNSAKELLYNSNKIIVGSTKSTTKYIFNMLLPEIEDVYYNDIARLAENAIEYYKQKGASMHCIKTPYSILN